MIDGGVHIVMQHLNDCSHLDSSMIDQRLACRPIVHTWERCCDMATSTQASSAQTKSKVVHAKTKVVPTKSKVV